MVGMTRAHMTDPHIVRKIVEGRESDIRPASAPTTVSTASIRAARPTASTIAATGRETTNAARTCEGRPAEEDRRRRRGSRRSGGGARRLGARSRRRRLRGGRRARRAGEAHSQKPAAPGNDRHHRLANGAMQARGVVFHFDILGGGAASSSRNRLTSSSSRPAVCRTRKCSPSGNDLVVSIVGHPLRRSEAGRECLHFDDAGDHAALQAAEVIAEAAARLRS